MYTNLNYCFALSGILTVLVSLYVMRKKADFLVIGSGLAGLSFALKAAGHGKVCLVTKSALEDTNTKFAQGGIAAVTYEPDSYRKHIEDTLKAGDGLCNPSIVELVVKEAPKQIEELIGWGASFDRKSSGEFDLAREGGHSEHRILHHKDNTGYEIQRVLSDQVRNHPDIEVLEGHFAVDLITQHHLGYLVKRYSYEIQCYGAYVLDLSSRKLITILAKNTLVATGGVGNLYHTTTNPPVATGDGIAMVYRAKGIIENMEFIQFHPTSLFNPGERPSFLITEAMRGFGAELRTQDGKPFMKKYDERGSLASRDIVARAIDNEMKARGDDFVYLDATGSDSRALKEHFPNICEKCLGIGIDITRDMIPVVPAAHYMCGGVRVDSLGRTSIRNLFAAGEAASTGLHGANRLASNSLIEAIVFADRAVRTAIEEMGKADFRDGIPDWDYSGTSHPEEMVLITQNYKEMQQIMSNYVGIVRSDLRLRRALDRLEIIYQETEDLYRKSTLSQNLCELRNMINTAYLIIKMAQERKESRGLHYNTDYPAKRLKV